MLRPLVPIFTGKVDELVERLTIRLRQEIPDYADMDYAELSNQADTQVRYVLDELAGAQVAPENGPAAYGRLRAEQGVPPEVVLHAYRVAWAELWAGLIDDVGTNGASTDQLLQASTAFFWMADEYARRMLGAYRRRAVELLTRQQAERGATLEGLFTGYLNGSEALWEAAALLDLPYHGHFVVIAAATPAPGREALPGIREVLQKAHINSAWRLAADLEAGIVALHGPAELGPLLDELKGHAGVRVGLSGPYTRLADTPHAMRVARLVLGTIPNGHSEIKQFTESPIGALLAASPDTAGELRRSVLGGLDELPREDQETLLLTLSTWYESSGSVTDAAKRLYVHPNTVRYRLRRVQAETQRNLDDPRDVADIWAALVANEMIPALRDRS
ncbi:PucR family transcriptional regulator [Pseudonocardia charpentierae]|uniref:Helix-turn-helix domain-containing protein n=1 Tax=Pseudonocardia charpentierae TaxID=3075545 RepID=A0ABU2NKP9_9PSEU|nr:helix-turn-helix domain-containing protein [Pseudonocardia sp. DSM 45834]MDT0353789.1 helix-turn-helix domain-containing protein [Pseudonocardia sp. DSM 45834]